LIVEFLISHGLAFVYLRGEPAGFLRLFELELLRRVRLEHEVEGLTRLCPDGERSLGDPQHLRGLDVCDLDLMNIGKDFWLSRNSRENRISVKSQPKISNGLAR
jgi:hypothetical protein